MAQNLRQASPGDLITAQDWNALVDAVNSALIRIAALEAGSQPGIGLDISRLVPDGPYRVGDRLQVIGRNFQYTIGATRVFLNTTQVLNLLPNSSDFLLEFDIPDVPGVSESGSPPVDLVVMNQSDSVTRQIVLRPRQSPLQGNVTVEYRSVTPTTVLPDQSATFSYRIRSGTNNRATWALSPQISVAANSAAWNSQLSLLDAGGNPLPAREITLDPAEERAVAVRIGSVPSGTEGVQFGVSLSVAADGITGSSGIRQFTVGSPDVPPDDTITLALQPAASSPDALVGSTLTVPAGGSRTLAIAATLTVAGTYDIAASVAGGATGWAVAAVAGTPGSYRISNVDLDASGQVQRLMRFSVSASAGASASGELEVRLQRRGNTAFQAVVVTLARG